MPTPFTINFNHFRSATAIEVARPTELIPALEMIGLSTSKTTMAVIGGAARFAPAEMEAVTPFLSEILLELIHRHDSYLVDGGTDAGLMQLIGRMRHRARAKFPLIGVATRRTVLLPDDSNPAPDAVPLEPNHTHFILVPGKQWGDESVWMSQIVGLLSRTNVSLTLLFNGGEISRTDVQHSFDAGRTVVAFAGSGRLADELARQPHHSDLLKLINLNEPNSANFNKLESLITEVSNGRAFR